MITPCSFLFSASSGPISPRRCDTVVVHLPGSPSSLVVLAGSTPRKVDRSPSPFSSSSFATRAPTTSCVPWTAGRQWDSWYSRPASPGSHHSSNRLSRSITTVSCESTPEPERSSYRICEGGSEWRKEYFQGLIGIDHVVEGIDCQVIVYDFLFTLALLVGEA